MRIAPRLLQILLGSFLALLWWIPTLYAQGVGSSGSILGTITDPTGDRIAAATVTAEDVDRGVKRTATTDDAGTFVISGLAPANYTVVIALTGFSTVTKKNIVVDINANVDVSTQLTIGPATTEIVVTGAAQAVETQQTQQAGYIEQKAIENLPINRRDYLSFALLLPGVTDSNTLASSTDYRVQQTPQSGLSINGSNGRGNNVTVDGGEANDDSGGVRSTVSQEAVQEFQVNRSSYPAELGGASGAAINIVTKSGTNRLHGSLFGYFRNDIFDAQDPFSYGPALAVGQPFLPVVSSTDSVSHPVKNSLSRQQFGGSVGFPIIKNKLFAFIAYEGLRRDEQASVPLLTNTSIFRPEAGQAALIGQLAARGSSALVPCLSTTSVIPANVCAGTLQAVLTVNPAANALNAFVLQQFENNGGLFPFSATSDLASVRLDHHWNDSNQMFLRVNFGRDNEANSNLQALTGFSRGTLIKTKDYTATASWFHLFNPTTQNELRAQFNNYRLDVASNDPGGPSLDVQGFGYFGRNIFLPNLTGLHRYELADTATFTRGRHTIKAGFSELWRADTTNAQTFFGGRFVFGAIPGGALSPCLQVPAACGLTAAPANINGLQALALGLPQYYQQGFGNPIYSDVLPLTAAFVQDSWIARPNLTFNFGLRYELDQRSSVMPTSYKDFAPRLGFAWDPTNSKRMVVRGGYGIFYSPIYFQIDDVVRTLGNINGARQISQVFVPLTGVPGNSTLTSAAIFQRLFAQGKISCGSPSGGYACITPADLTQFGININPTGPVAPLSALFGVDPNYRNPYTHQANLGVERDLGKGWALSGSYLFARTLHLPWAVDTNLLPAPVTPINGVPVRNWAAPQCSTNPFSCFVNPLLLQNNIYSSVANALYNAGVVELRKRLSGHVSLLVNYTFSKALDDATDYNSDYEAADQTNRRAEHALSDFDQRHRFVASGTFESPFKNTIGGGWVLSPIFRANSGRPFNLLAGSDLNGDHHSTNDRPAGAGRNTGIGPAYYSLDLRLARQFQVREHAAVQFLAEAFNLANHTNYASVNNVVGNITGPFNLQGSSNLSPSQALGFTADYPKRQLQLGVRLTF